MKTEKKKRKWELNEFQKRAIRETLAIILPVIIGLTITMMINYYIRKNLVYLPRYFRFLEFILHDITFPNIILAILMKTAFALMIGLPIGIFSTKKMKYVILGIDITILFIIWYLHVGFETFQNYTNTEIAYMIIDPLIFAGIIIIGYLVGRYLTKDMWKKEKLT